MTLNFFTKIGIGTHHFYLGFFEKAELNSWSHLLPPWCQGSLCPLLYFSQIVQNNEGKVQMKLRGTMFRVIIFYVEQTHRCIHPNLQLCTGILKNIIAFDTHLRFSPPLFFLSTPLLFFDRSALTSYILFFFMCVI